MKRLRFWKVIIEKAVKLRWETWDLTADDPKFYPPGGEPENYIECRKHDPALARAMNPLWQMLVPEDKTYVLQCDSRYYFRSKSKPRFGLFIPGNMGFVVVSDAAMQWLEKEAGQWLKFKPVKAVRFHSSSFCCVFARPLL